MFASKDTLLTRPSGGYTIARSVRTRASASAYLNRTPATSGTGGAKIWSYSTWFKRGSLGSNQALFWADASSSPSDTNNMGFAFQSGDTLSVQGQTINFLVTSQVFRDPAAWYHAVLTCDTTQATASNRLKLYINGLQVTSFSTANYPSQNATVGIGLSNPTFIGAQSPTPAQYFDGYLTEINFVDGQALTPSSFGSTNAITGVWQPAKYTGTYGTNGFYLNFSDNSSNTSTTIGKDYSGNGNNWTPNNISVTAGVTYDSMTDVPTLTSATAANYCVLNPLDGLNTAGSNLGTFSNGNLDYAVSGSSGNAPRMNCVSTMYFPSSGKWYSEFTNISNRSVGIVFGSVNQAGVSFTKYITVTSGSTDSNDGSVTSGASTTITTSDIIGVAYDIGSATLTFYKNNTQFIAFGSVTTSTSYSFGSHQQSSGTAGTVIANFGQRPFSYTPPTGFVALNTYNLPASTITNGAAYMAATTYTGNSSARSLSNANNGVSFQPDLVWIKDRTTAGIWNVLFDSVRGVGNQLSSNQTDAELASASNVAGKVSAFNSDGFSVVTGSSSYYSVNQTSENYIGWQWKAGTTSSSNTNGSITSTVSVGATQGFSVVTYTGNSTNNATVGHGLGVVPSMIILKNRSGAYDWPCYHISIGSGGYIYLNLTAAKATDVNMWKTTPTSTVFTLGTYTENNGSANNYVAYCFAAVAGYSAFGSYTGNGSADGPFVFTGMRPRFVMIKRTDGVGDWWMYDTSRSASNTANLVLYANSSAAEISDSIVDILSNGFKLRQATYQPNTSGATFIYACFAENPMKYALAR